MIYTNSFKKDLKKIQKRGKNLSLLEDIMRKLSIPEKLDEKNYDHSLKGRYISHRECHIEPDWLLIYRIKENDILFFRTGSHADLFK